jgi:glutamate-1-semialdehyde 2,1-aminomutase
VNSPVRAFRNVGGEPFLVAKAEGSRLRDVEGREYIDYVGTWGPAILGHAPDVVVEAVREAAMGGLSFGIPNPLEVEMARLLCTWVPSLEKVRMVNSGNGSRFGPTPRTGESRRLVATRTDQCRDGNRSSADFGFFFPDLRVK